MPPSGFNEKAIKGLLYFIKECYMDLLKGMDGGADSKEAIQKEIDDIESFLKGFKI